jgi:hypothetical protein
LAGISTNTIGKRVGLSRVGETILQPIFGMLQERTSACLVREGVVGSVYKLDSYLAAASRQFQDVLEIIEFACPGFGAVCLSSRSLEEEYGKTVRRYIFPTLQKR